MNKEIFLRELRRFLAGIPEDEREQAISYYEDYFEDAGSENEEKVIAELGSPIELAKQIMSANQENIAYGQGNDFHRSNDYPNVYATENNNGQSATNFESSTANTQSKKSWTQDSSKVTLVVILALLAIPVGIPLITTFLSILVAALAVIFTLIGVGFCCGFALALEGIVTLFGSFLLITAGNPANVFLTAGVALIMFSIGCFLLWLSILICKKFFPAAWKGISCCYHFVKKKAKDFFN